MFKDLLKLVENEGRAAPVARLRAKKEKAIEFFPRSVIMIIA